jgi:transposase
MKEAREGVVSLSTEIESAEERMLGVELVQEMVARKERGEGVKRIARELGVDRKTVKRWLKLGAWQPREVQRRARQLDRFAEFIERRAPEVGFNGAVL